MINSYNEAIERLSELVEYEDYEVSHEEADDILSTCLQLAVTQNWTIEQANAIRVTYEAVGKWYA